MPHESRSVRRSQPADDEDDDEDDAAPLSGIGTILKFVGCVVAAGALIGGAVVGGLPTETRITLAVEGCLGGVLLVAVGVIVNAAEATAHWSEQTAKAVTRRR